jgi:hypothetical protein
MPEVAPVIKTTLLVDSTNLALDIVDSGGRCNGFMKTEFGRLCQAL